MNDGVITNVPEFISELALKETSLRLNPRGSVLIAMYGATIGKVGVLDIESTTNQACCACICYKGILNWYLLYYLLAQREYFISKGFGGAQPNISREKIVATLFPLPPLSEQKRIVEEIEKIFGQIEVLKENQEELNKLKDGLKNKVLDLAIQGKLVEQDPTDEPASVLLEKIKAEKLELIKQGKIKKDKQESYIYKGADNRHYEKIGSEIKDITEEIPFEIPNNWCWCRLKDICNIFGRIGFRGYTKNDIVTKGQGAITISPSNIKNGKTVFDNNTYISWEKYYESPEIMIYNDDIILVKTGSSYGKSAIVLNLKEKATLNPQLVVLKYILTNRQYLDCILQSSFSINQFEDFVIGTAIPTFSQEKLSQLLLPLPPLSEQMRIVEKLKNVKCFIEHL